MSLGDLWPLQRRGSNKKGWGDIVGGILGVCSEPDFLSNAEDVAIQLDDTFAQFTELVHVLVEHPQGCWKAAELADLSVKHGLLKEDLGEGTPRALSTRMGSIVTRYIGESFKVADGQLARFHKEEDRKGNVYRVSVSSNVPNLEVSAEPLPNLGNAQVRHA